MNYASCVSQRVALFRIFQVDLRVYFMHQSWISRIHKRMSKRTYRTGLGSPYRPRPRKRVRETAAPIAHLSLASLTLLLQTSSTILL